MSQEKYVNRYSQLLWVPARHGGVLFTTRVGTVLARLGTAQRREIYIQFLALVKTKTLENEP